MEIDDEAPIGEDVQGLLSGDQVAPVEKENKDTVWVDATVGYCVRAT